ncbi:MAG: lipid-A-disaccharide synthase [Acidobacteriota bacterium]
MGGAGSFAPWRRRAGRLTEVDRESGAGREEVEAEGNTRRVENLLVVAGEPSGDRHAAGLVQALQRTYPDVSWRVCGYGGGALEAAGVELVDTFGGRAAIGPQAALGQVGHYWRVFRELLAEVERRGVRTAVLVDFPDFNLRLAKKLKEHGCRVVYFIAPQVWAWREGRVKQIRRRVDLMLVIFPFEEQYFRRQGVPALYVGNPTAVRFSSRRRLPPRQDGKQVPLIALLPGSRVQEVRQILPIELDAARFLARCRPVRFRIVRAPEIAPELVADVMRKWWKRRGAADLRVEVVAEPLEVALNGATAAVVKSGTATLETMLAGVPFAMVYRLGWLSWALLRPLVRRQSFCLANLVAGEEIAPEFVQWNARGDRIGRWLDELLARPEAAARIQARMAAAAERLGRGDAYGRAAAEVGRLLGIGETVRAEMGSVPEPGRRGNTR